MFSIMPWQLLVVMACAGLLLDRPPICYATLPLAKPDGKSVRDRQLWPLLRPNSTIACVLSKTHYTSRNFTIDKNPLCIETHISRRNYSLEK